MPELRIFLDVNKKEFATKFVRAERASKSWLDKLEIFQSERVASAGGGRGGLGVILPALQILGEISLNFFESTPPSFSFSEIERCCAKKVTRLKLER